MPEFDEAYVKKLRDENASWRNKVRELEAQQHRSVIEVELAKRSVVANPDWVSIEEDQTAIEAVDSFLTQYPHLVIDQNTPDLDDNEYDLDEPRKTPKPLPPSHPRSNTPKPAMDTRISSRNIAEIRKDPKARAKIRSQYRALLKVGSNQGEC